MDGWAADTTAGAEVALLAWRRANVAELNSRARAWTAATGRLTGPELAVDGVSYRAGDKVVALAPDRDAGLVTSQRATVTHVDVNTGMVIVHTDDDRQVTLGGGQLGADRVGHAYAATVHRFQGSTVERTHLFADGGGRELAYVAMSRARHASTAYVVADDIDQASEDLTRDWATKRAPVWAIDTGLPDTRQGGTDPGSIGERERAAIVAVRHAHDRLLAQATRPGRPPAPPDQAEAARAALHRAQQHLAELASVTGAYAAGPIGDAARHTDTAGARLAQLEHLAANGGWRERRQAHRDLPDATSTAADAEDRLVGLVDAERSGLGQQIGRLRTMVEDLDQHAVTAEQRWQVTAGQHAVVIRGERRLGRILETARRLHELVTELQQPTARQVEQAEGWLTHHGQDSDDIEDNPR